jgi:transcriptional regulator with XRE-family HTH domain
LAGVDRSMVWRLLHGQRRPSVEVAARIAVALESTRPTVGPERRTDVIGRVQHELAADPFLKPRDIRRVMSHYARLRAGIGSGSSSAGGSLATGEQPAAVEAGSLPPTP